MASVTNLCDRTILEHQKRDGEIEAFAMASLFDSAEVSKTKRARNTQQRSAALGRRRGRVEPREQRRQRRCPVVRVLPSERRCGRAEPEFQRRQCRRPVMRVLPAERRRGRAEPRERRR